MTLTTPYSATFIVGDGETKVFSYLFEEVSENFISVMVYNSVTGLVSTPTYIVDTDQKQVIFGDDTPAPTADETVCIYRNTPNVQDTPFRTLQGYDAKALENILSKIVAMIQEIKSNYFSTQVLQGDPWQLDLLTSADDGATVNIDYTAKKLVKGLYFRITSGNLQVSADGSTYITMPKSDDVAEFRQVQVELPDHTYQYKLQYRVGSAWYDAEANAQNTADAAYSLASTVQADLSSHTNNQNNPHQTSLVNLTDTNIVNPVNGQFMMFDGLKWKNVYSSATASWGTILGNIADQTDLKDALDTKVNIDGTSTMTAPLKFASGSMRGAVGPYLNGVSFWKMDSQGNITNIANLTDSRFLPVTTNAIDLGRTANTWKDLYLGGKAYVATINNGADLSVPNKSGTLATTADVELAARSGRMLTDQGVWYAKMYSATVAPSAEDGTNYADFSQVDQDDNPIIVIYERQSGAWVQSETITPPADYDGYVPITSKIWDITEQSGQQGGRVLWNHTSKEFTPYPVIISFEDIEITGDSTVIMPENPTANQIVNKDYVDNAISSAISQGSDFDLFDHKWRDATTSNARWALSDGNWVTDKPDAYQHLVDDYNAALAEVPRFLTTTNNLTMLRNPEYDRTVSDVDYYAWTKRGHSSLLDTYFTTTLSPGSGYQLYKLNPDMQPSSLYVSSVDDGTNTETIAGRTITYYKAPDGHKIALADQDNTAYLIYVDTGVAWYYILDTANQQFKLPRVNPGVVEQGYGTIPIKGTGKTLGLTNGTNNTGLYYTTSTASRLAVSTDVYGASLNSTVTNGFQQSGSKSWGITTDATKSGIVADVDAQTTIFCGKKYLYFYVGN